MVAAAVPKIASAVAAGFKVDTVTTSVAWWRWVATGVVDLLSADGAGAAAKALKLEAKRSAAGGYDAPRLAILAEIASDAATPQGLRYVIAVCLAGVADAAGSTYSPKHGDRFTKAAATWKVDLAAIAAEVAASTKKATADKAAGKKSKPAKKAAGKGKKS